MSLEEVITGETMRIHTVTDLMYECNACRNGAEKGSFRQAMVPCIISLRWIGVGADTSGFSVVCLKTYVQPTLKPNWVEKYREEIQVET